MTQAGAKAADESVRVMVVGHTVVSAESFSKSLTSAGLEVVATSHELPDALVLLSSQEVDVIVVEGGADLLDELRATRLIKDTRPSSEIVLIGLHHHRDAVEFAAAGASGYVLRDEALERLPAAVRSAHHKLTLCTPRVAEEVLARIRTLSSAAPEPPPAELLDHLTEREDQILQLMASGRLNKEIGRELDIALSTVKNHVHNILTKLGSKDRRQASRLASVRTKS